MTTIRKYLEAKLFSNGLWEDQASAVVTAYENSSGGQAMKGRMDDDISGYPSSMMIFLWIMVEAKAVEWIDANCPKHWARSMFTGVSQHRTGTV